MTLAVTRAVTVAVAERTPWRTDDLSGRSFLYLASRSPHRSLLLAQLDVAYETLDIAVDEGWDGREAPCRYVGRLALAKARAGGSLLATRPAPVLGADTAVVLDGEILGKPEGADEALCMLARLSGRCHEVYTAVALWIPDGPITVGPASSRSRVCFRPLTVAEQRAYVASREPYGKAGAYAIQGLAAAFIERIEGSYSGIMGLPLCDTATLLHQIGFPRPRPAPGASEARRDPVGACDNLSGRRCNHEIPDPSADARRPALRTRGGSALQPVVAGESDLISLQTTARRPRPTAPWSLDAP